MSDSSSSIDYDSSSSSSITPSKELFGSSVVQNHNAIIPFTCFGEQGTTDNAEIKFTINTATSEFDYSMILSQNLSSSTSTGIVNNGVYIPEEEESQYQHDPMVFVDIMVRDTSGFKGYSLRSQVNKYRYEDVQSSFNVPKFSWDSSIFGSSGSPVISDDPILGSVWIGNDNKFIFNVAYSANSASVNYSTNVSSEIRNIVFNRANSETYISQYDHLSKFLIDSYFDGTDTSVEAEEELTILNQENDIITSVHGGAAWSIEAYNGKVINRDPDTMLPLVEYGGFDAPSKVIWSSFHNANLVAGTNILWKLSNGIKESVYSIDGYDIEDFDVSSEGIVVLMLHGVNNDIVRILKNDFYGILVNETIELAYASKCRYCEQGKFYMLVELNSGIGSYETVQYIYDSKSNILSKSVFATDILVPTTTTTTPTTTNKIEIDIPNSDISWEIGSEQEIKWRSIDSATDGVKIELYKNDKLFDTITELTLNSGLYKWIIPETYESSSAYKIKITWLSSSNVAANYDISEAFVLTNIPQTTTTTTTQIVDRAIGVDYNSNSKDIVIILSNGLLGFFNIETLAFRGLLDAGIDNATCMSVKEDLISEFSEFSKVRVFVGSDIYLSDKWDSGIVETNLSSIYYGGGNNLIPGEKYYVNIQVYSDELGWSGIQTKEWIMPK